MVREFHGKSTNFLIIQFIILWQIERLIAQEELDVDVTSAILIGLKHNLDSSRVVRSACMALTSLISFAGKKNRVLMLFYNKIFMIRFISTE